jgi:hypothetical protein
MGGSQRMGVKQSDAHRAAAVDGLGVIQPFAVAAKGARAQLSG